MHNTRRTFLKCLSGTAGMLVLGGTSRAAQERTAGFGVLVDTARCVGCRSCEQACNEVNTDLPRKHPEHFKDLSVLEQKRRMDSSTYTVVNSYQNGNGGDSKPVFAKF